VLLFSEGVGHFLDERGLECFNYVILLGLLQQLHLPKLFDDDLGVPPRAHDHVVAFVPLEEAVVEVHCELVWERHVRLGVLYLVRQQVAEISKERTSYPLLEAELQEFESSLIIAYVEDEMQGVVPILIFLITVHLVRRHVVSIHEVLIVGTAVDG